MLYIYIYIRKVVSQFGHGPTVISFEHNSFYSLVESPTVCKVA
jgi:hypothetical protein